MQFDDLKTLYIDAFINCIVSTTDLNTLTRRILDETITVSDVQFPQLPSFYDTPTNPTEQMLNHIFPNIFDLTLLELVRRYPITESAVDFASYIENAGSTAQPEDWDKETFVCPSLGGLSYCLRLVEWAMLLCATRDEYMCAGFPCEHTVELRSRSSLSYLKVSFLLSLVISSTSLPHLSFVVAFLEQLVHRGVLQRYLQDRMIGYSLLRCLNTIPKRLSSTQHYSLLGRILMYTAFAFPMHEKAQLNLIRATNDDALTLTEDSSDDIFCAHLQAFHNAQLNTEALLSNPVQFTTFQTALEGLVKILQSYPHVAVRRPDYTPMYRPSIQNGSRPSLETESKNGFRKHILSPALLSTQLEDLQTRVCFYYHIIFVVFSILTQVALTKDDRSSVLPSLRTCLSELFRGQADSSVDGPAECAFLVQYMMNKELRWHLWKITGCESVVVNNSALEPKDVVLGFDVPATAEYEKFKKEVERVQHELNGNEYATGVEQVVEQHGKIVCPLIPVGSASLMLLTESYIGGTVSNEFDKPNDVVNIEIEKTKYNPITYTEFDEEPVEILKRRRRAGKDIFCKSNESLEYNISDYTFPPQLTHTNNSAGNNTTT